MLMPTVGITGELFAKQSRYRPTAWDALDDLSCEEARSFRAWANDKLIDERFAARALELYAIMKNCALQQTTREEIFDAQLHGMVAALNDPHATYLNEEEYRAFQDDSNSRYFGIGVELDSEVEEGKFVLLRVVMPRSGSPAAKAGIQKGDRILKINKRPLRSYRTFREIQSDIRGKQHTPVTLLIGREGEKKPLLITIVRDEIIQPVMKTTMLQSKWLVIALESFSGRILPSGEQSLCVDVEEAYKRALLSESALPGVVLDLRQNGGGLMGAASCLVNLFAPKRLEGKSLISIETRDGIIPGTAWVIDPKDLLKGKPLVILVDELSASASEVVAKALQYYDVGVIVGTRTFGKGLIQNIQLLSDGKTALKYTYGQYLVGSREDPVPVQTVGVTPNIRIKVPERSEAEKALVVQESDISTVKISTHATDRPVKNIRETNPALYQTIVTILREEPLLIEVE